MLKHYKDLRRFLRTCNTLTLSPDFMIPQEIMYMEEEMTSNETPHSTIVDCSDDNQPIMSWSSGSGSSGSENISSVTCQNNNIVRKKRSSTSTTGFYVCGRSANYNKVSDHEDMATSMISRRKGIPHRSPLY